MTCPALVRCRFRHRPGLLRSFNPAPRSGSRDTCAACAHQCLHWPSLLAPDLSQQHATALCRYPATILCEGTNLPVLDAKRHYRPWDFPCATKTLAELGVRGTIQPPEVYRPRHPGERGRPRPHTCFAPVEAPLLGGEYLGPQSPRPCCPTAAS